MKRILYSILKTVICPEKNADNNIYNYWKSQNSQTSPSMSELYRKRKLKPGFHALISKFSAGRGKFIFNRTDG